MFQYFITVVPTKLNTHKISADTHQFSVTERVREIEFVSRVGVSANCQKTHQLFVSPGAGDKPRGGQPRRLWHLCEVRHQLPDGDGQRAAHAAVAVPGATVRHRRRDFLHDGQVQSQLFSKSGRLTHRLIPSLLCSPLQACSTVLWDSVLMSSAVASSSAPIDPER